ncbi:MAG: hypothetical protein A2Y13_07765 [Planctomycetes bacterium GWC2_45_44]|nr:MAG: hypothetical protein A2Y13_07765 [Planctomycetes bacterium GWC2_45_44]
MVENKAEISYLQWLATETPTQWWHDSAEPAELEQGILHKASGVTTNPVLIAKTLQTSPGYWAAQLKGISCDLALPQRTEQIIRGVVCRTAKLFEVEYENSQGERGYVCAQVNPSIASDVNAMVEMAKRFSEWAPNISVKLPATASGLEALEECIAQGISITSTVSHSVPQVIAVAERHHKGMQRAVKAGKRKAKCFAVIMIGRIDDYLRNVADDIKADVSESDIMQAGIAVTKRAYSIFKERKYETTLLVAALRGAYHMEALTGADLIVSIHPKYQMELLKPAVLRDSCRIEVPVDAKVITRLSKINDFVRIYESEGMKPQEFITYGLTQRTLEQFFFAGWSIIENWLFNKTKV